MERVECKTTKRCHCKLLNSERKYYFSGDQIHKVSCAISGITPADGKGTVPKKLDLLVPKNN